MEFPEELKDWMNENGSAMMEEDAIHEKWGDVTPPFGWAVNLAHHKGGEGEGDQYWTVWRFQKGDEDFYVKFHGWYVSYYGTEYNGCQIVTPVERKVTFYE